MADSRISKPCVVYGLISSSNPEVRYIGQTVRTLSTRLRRHINDAKRGGQTPKDRWIRKVIDSGCDVLIVPLIQDAIPDEDEIRLIRQYREQGFNLLNLLDGGQGCLNPTPEYREKMSAARKEFWNTPEGKAIASARSVKTWQNPEVAERRVLSLKAALATPEARLNRSQSAKNRRKDPEALKRQSEKLKAAWRDEKKRDARCKLIRESLNNPEYKERLSKRLQKQWEDQDRRAAMSEKMKGRRFSPETIEKMRQGARARWEKCRQQRSSQLTLNLGLANTDS